MAAATHKQFQMNVLHGGAKTPPRTSSFSDRKRRFEVLKSPDVSKNGLFPIFSPPVSPSKTSKSPASSSPSKKKANRVIKQGANQNNKILRYLQPKRLLPSFENQATSVSPFSVHSFTNEDKENKLQVLKVTLVRIDDSTFQEHSYCMLHRSPKKLCCNAASEYVAQALESMTLKDALNPCKRLGISMPMCLTASGCHHEKLAEASSPYQSLLFSTMVDADLEVMMIRATCLDLSATSYPSPAIVRAIFNIMKESADKKTIDFGRSVLKRVISSFPPCTPKMKFYYLNVLHTGNLKVNMPANLWSFRSLEFFEETLTEVEDLIEGLLNPNQLKEKLKNPGIRKVRKPRRFRETPSPGKKSDIYRRKQSTHDICEEVVEDFDLNDFGAEALRKKQLRKEAILAMSHEEKTDHAFSRFEVLVDILEWDLIVWLSKQLDYTKIRDRAISPLIVLALWRPESDTGFDSVHCRRIFSMYVSAWVLKFHPRHLRTLGRLIGLIAEVTSASEPNYGNVHPYTGDSCDNLSRKLGEALKNTQVEELRAKAVGMLKPDWLQMQVSANLLGISPSVSSMDMKTLLEPMSDITMSLWAVFLEAVIKIHHLKDAMSLLELASKGFFKEEFLMKHPVSTSNHQINYKALLREITAFYKLRCDISKCNTTGNVPGVLIQILTA